MGEKWSQNLFITFDETDLSGVVYFAHTFKLAHKFIELFIMDQGIEWNLWFHHPQWAVPLKQANCDYINPLFAGQVCIGQVTLTRRGDSSISF